MAGPPGGPAGHLREVAEVPGRFVGDRQLAADDPGRAQARVSQAQACGAAHGENCRQPQQRPHGEPVVLSRGPGHIGRHAQGCDGDDHAAEAMTVLASTETSELSRRLDLEKSGLTT